MSYLPPPDMRSACSVSRAHLWGLHLGPLPSGSGLAPGWLQPVRSPAWEGGGREGSLGGCVFH